MTTPPHIFDRTVLKHRRARARRRFADHSFLHERAAADVIDRLETVTRAFQKAVVFGPGAALVAEALTPACDVGTLSVCDPFYPEKSAFLADEEAPPLAPQSLDLVISFMALHAVNDVRGAAAQMARALKPDGLFIAVLFGGETLHELRDALSEAEVEVSSGVSPRVFPFGEVRDLGGVLQGAGLALPVADVERSVVRYENPLKLFQDLRGMAETNVLAERRRAFTPRALMMRALELYAAKHQGADGRLPATFDLITLTGWAPHESQQKPLAPGSAKSSMAEAVRRSGSEKD